jgi:ribosome-binding factor A
MESKRQQKIARFLQKEMSELFENEGRDLFPGAMITITKVNVTRDMSIARFYLSLFSVKNKQNLLETIRKHTPEFHYKLGNRIRRQLRVVPGIEFFEDDSLDYIENIENLLKK